MIIQKRKTSSLNLVIITVLTFCQALESYASMNEYNKNSGINLSIEDLSDNKDKSFEEEKGNYVSIVFFVDAGIWFFRLGIYHLLSSMFKLEPLHLATTFLHLRYRLLKKCSFYIKYENIIYSYVNI